ncbi:MAG: hypothetical protein OXB84_02110, partial [Halobacteriovoraceae bacterium]|nr:hypothetical protein [Halobacteriovoraceae bacterium]
FSASDLASVGDKICRGEGNFVVKGSTFEYLIDLTAKTDEAIISNCSPEELFKGMFVKLFEILASRIDKPKLLIADTGVPICASTVKVYYKDNPLPKGSIESGGIWRFDWDSNAILFNDLDFLDKNEEDQKVRVEFDMDNGFDESC